MMTGCFVCVCVCVCVFVCVFSRFNCVWLWNSIEYNPLRSSVHRIFLAKILEWVVMPSSRGSSQSRDGTHDSCAGRFFTTEPLGKPMNGCYVVSNAYSSSIEIIIWIFIFTLNMVNYIYSFSRVKPTLHTSDKPVF